MVHKMKALLVLGAFAMVAGTAQAQIATTAKCETGKVKCVINEVKGLLGCDGKAAKLGAPVDTLCVNKVLSKFSAPGVCAGGANVGDPCTLTTQAVDCPASFCKVKSCMEKLDAKAATNPCLTLHDGPVINSKVQAFVNAQVGTQYTNPLPPGANACFAAQQKCIANLVKANLGCESKAVKTGLPVDTNCLAKAVTKFTNGGVPSGTGCMDKLTAPGKACTSSGVGTNANITAVLGATQAFNTDVRAELMPNNVFVITTVTGSGACGSLDSAGGALINLQCGDLNIGGGNPAIPPPGAPPAGSTTKFSVLGTGNPRAVVGATPAVAGSSRKCSVTGCTFGSPLPIVNSTSSTCVINTFTAPASGTLNIATGTFTGNFQLLSQVYFTANPVSPCPICSGGFCTVALNAGAPCTADSATGQSHDCIPAGVPLPPFAVSLNPLATGTSTQTAPSGEFCPSQLDAGAFGQPTAITITENGSAGGNLTDAGIDPMTLASVFCIPSTGNGLIDGAASLPGPGATALPYVVDLQ